MLHQKENLTHKGRDFFLYDAITDENRKVSEANGRFGGANRAQEFTPSTAQRRRAKPAIRYMLWQIKYQLGSSWYFYFIRARPPCGERLTVFLFLCKNFCFTRR
jgi:hypothetical protein